MAKRKRRIFKIKNSSLFASIIVFHLVLISGASSYHHQAHHRQRHRNWASPQEIDLSEQQQQLEEYKLSSQPAILSTNQISSIYTPTYSHLCSHLPRDISRQLRLCRLVQQSREADEAVTVGASKGLAECRNQLKSERWNCTHADGDHHLLTSELAQSVGNRESGFVHAIAAAGIVHSIAHACSVGSLSDCACDKSRIGLIKRNDIQPPDDLLNENWKWGGCSNNIKHGMIYARLLVELLDAVHQHSRQQQKLRLATRHLGKRSLSSKNREPNQVRARHSPSSTTTTTTTTTAYSSEHTQQSRSSVSGTSSFCQRNHNISQATHIELVKSLLAKNSLEKHQKFRIAMNMHNNKVGRMAVTKNMRFNCRCHGLSGSCSLKTCWVTLPNFQVIGAYLKKKYDSSVHLPSAVNVNKLISMMDRNEISAILSSQSSNSLNTAEPGQAATSTTTTAPTTTTTTTTKAPTTTTAPIPISGHFIAVSPSSNTLSSNSLQRQQLQQNIRINQKPATTLPLTSNTNQSRAQQLTSSDNEIPVNLAPMTEQQYQALLRETKLCNNQKSLGLHLSQLLHTNNKDDLIHLHKSPDYCEADLRHGFVGVKSRVCSSDPMAPDSCDKLCCGRGSGLQIYQETFNCDCKFQYCCSILCQVCEKEIRALVCH